MAKQSGSSSKLRRWNPTSIQRVLNYADKHKHSETLEKFRISSSQLHIWKTRARSNAVHDELAKSTFESKSRGKEIVHLVLVKKLRRVILERIKTQDDIGEVELTGLLLVAELLKRK